jgi:hypothetical protein
MNHSTGNVGELKFRHAGAAKIPLVPMPAVPETGYAMPMTRDRVLNLYFIEARSKLIDVAAFLDRMDRAEGADDFRIKAFRQALKELEHGKPERAKRVLLSLSDPTVEPLPAATTKAASGAWPGIK